MSLLEIENGSLYYFQAWEYVKGEYTREFYLEKDLDYEELITSFEGYFVKPHGKVDINEDNTQKISDFIKYRLKESRIDTSKKTIIVFASQQDCEEVYIEDEGFTPESNNDMEDGVIITNLIKDGTVWNQPIFQMMEKGVLG